MKKETAYSGYFNLLQLLVGTVGYYFMPKKFEKNKILEVDHINVSSMEIQELVLLSPIQKISKYSVAIFKAFQ